jgi:hypothetical protein
MLERRPEDRASRALDFAEKALDPLLSALPRKL